MNLTEEMLYHLPNPEIYSSLPSVVQDAMLFAFVRHLHQTRKCTDTLMFSHLAEVFDLLFHAAPSNPSLWMAGLLHDVIEDTIDHNKSKEFSTIKEQIEQLFGTETLQLILSNTENKLLSWNDRKQHTIDFIKTAPLTSKMLIVADKFSNLKSLVKDFSILGDDMWTHFNRGKKEQAWYFLSVAKNMKRHVPEENIPAYFVDFQSLAHGFFIS